ASDVRHIFKQLGVDLDISKKEAKAKLFSLFPYGYVQQACKISGMRRPRGWSTG
ncbi:MAG: TusE/DsrC/DsvC family sulfur relay protein, partial [Candidatus Thioglobus sp.]